MALPPFAIFPQVDVRQKIPPPEWELYLASWTSLSELYLRLGNEAFSSSITETGSLPLFLISYFKSLADDDTLAASTHTLRKKCFLLFHRIYSGEHIPLALLSWSNLANVCHAFPKSEQLRTLLQSLWKRRTGDIEKGLLVLKTSLIKTLDSKTPGDIEPLLNGLGPLMRASPEAGMFMFTGSDFVDSLCNAYPKVSTSIQKKLVATTYFGLESLVEAPKPNYSLLSDHLYSLKTTAEQEQKSKSSNSTFLGDLVTNTPLLHKLRDSTTTAEGARVKNIAASLSTFRQSGTTRPKKLIRRKMEKGKGKAKDDEYGHGAFGDIHVHRMSLVSQIRDLFPDLGSAFVVKLLDEYNDNSEEVIAHLLEDDLPPHLVDADKSEQLPTTESSSHPRLTPRSTPPLLPQRRNIFDNDDFDKLAVDTSRLHIGRKNERLTADNLLADRSGAPQKSAILAALAAFDADDDERDDTYDVEDVGGTVDSAAPGADEVDADLRDRNEEALYRAYTTSPELFGRDAERRRGKPRAALKSETGMTDEAIEGWGIMIGRDPRRLRRLEAKFATFSGQQRELASTAYRESPAESGEEGSGDGQRGGRGGFAGRGRGRGRGRGGGGGGGGGNVAGPSDDKATQASRRGKEANKG